MNAKLTQDELRAIKERADKATDGPWWFDGCTVVREGGTPDFVEFLTWADRHGDTYMTERDGEFIANARQDIPKLVAEVERLREALSIVLAVELNEFDDMYYEAVRMQHIAEEALE